MGAPSDSEIPLLLTLFYLYRELATSDRSASGSKAALPGAPSQAVDIVRWGVWLGRHIC